MPVASAALLPAALALGFELHHAEKSHLMLTCWLPGVGVGVKSANGGAAEPNPLPPYNSHSVGVGACVVNDQGQVLAVQERCVYLKAQTFVYLFISKATTWNGCLL